YGSYKKFSQLDFLQSYTDFETELFDYQSSIERYIEAADLVIGHAGKSFNVFLDYFIYINSLLLGAGTALEVLRRGKPLLIVINEQLMDNHQDELALDLAENQFAVCSYPSNLLNALRSLDVSTLKPFPKPDPNKFGAFINRIYQQKFVKNK